MTEMELRQSCCNRINNWVGATPGSAKHLEILSIYNNDLPLPRGVRMTTAMAYCATTYSAAMIAEGIVEYTGKECGVEKLVEIAKRKGIWVENDAHVPKLGDGCVYDWQDDGDGDCVGYSDHIGMVTAANGSTFTVTEGNMTGGVVGKRSLQVNARYIRGFICPDFAAAARYLTGTGAVITPAVKTNRTKVQERFGFDDNTMVFLDGHKYKDALYEKLATKP